MDKTTLFVVLLIILAVLLLGRQMYRLAKGKDTGCSCTKNLRDRLEGHSSPTADETKDDNTS